MSDTETILTQLDETWPIAAIHIRDELSKRHREVSAAYGMAIRKQETIERLTELLRGIVSDVENYASASVRRAAGASAARMYFIDAARAADSADIVQGD